MSDEEEYFIVKKLPLEDIESPSFTPSEGVKPSQEVKHSQGFLWLLFFLILLSLIIYQAYTHSK